MSEISSILFKSGKEKENGSITRARAKMERVQYEIVAI